MRWRKDPASWPRWFRPLVGSLAIAGGIAWALFGRDTETGGNALDWGAMALTIGMIVLLVVVVVLIPRWVHRTSGRKH